MHSPASRKQGSPVKALTPREKQICKLLAFGHTNREMAEMLAISERTVETHRANLIAKLGLRSRSELVQFALENRLLKMA